MLRANLPTIYPTYPLETLRELVFQVAYRYDTRLALQTKKNGSYRTITYAGLFQSVQELATGLSELGLSSGDRLAVLGENRIEWVLTYLAAVASGIVVVPLDPELKSGEISHLISHARVRAVILSGRCSELMSKVHLDKQLDHIRISMEDQRNDSDWTFPEVLDLGRSQLAIGDECFQSRIVRETDLAAIIFTSGTTGKPKGVVLTHGNIASNIVATSRALSIGKNDVVLSVLPLHHTYECTCGFLVPLYQGALISHAESLRRLAENMQEVKASVMLGVPLLFENINKRIQNGIQASGPVKYLICSLITSLPYSLVGFLCKRLFRPVKEKFGGRLRLLICGGAPLKSHVSKELRSLGIDFIQGYGLTEASPLVTVNRLDYYKDDSVGIPLSGICLKIVDGEILVRGPNVMKGYYRDPEATRTVLQDGWLHTGDQGYLDKAGFLHINGRLKSVIVTSNGKNVHPEEIEELLGKSPYILESLVWGGYEENSKGALVQAIIVPSLETFDENFGSESCTEEQIRKIIGREVKRCSAQLANYKRIRKFTLRMTEFEKTTTRKVKRFLYTGKGI